MTRTANARLAGVAFLLYIVVGISDMVFFGGTTAGTDIHARLATMAQRAGDVRISVLLDFVMSMCAFILGTTLYAITREEDQDLAMLGLVCRVAEGVSGAVLMAVTLALLQLASAADANAADRAGLSGVAPLMFAARSWHPSISATFFSVGSLLFSWLLLRGRMIPVWLAWLGVLASALLVVGLPLQLLRGVRGTASMTIWMPMLVFEVAVAFWFLIKGVAPQRSTFKAASTR